MCVVIIGPVASDTFIRINFALYNDEVKITDGYDFCED
jgi:hypothetical protein